MYDMEKEGLGKRGQGLPITTLILIIIGIVVAVVIIIGFTVGWDAIFGKVPIVTPSTLEAKVKACEIAAENELKIDYCTKFDQVEISGKKQAVNCAYLKSNNLLSASSSAVDCGSLIGDTKIVEYCVNTKKKDSDLVNGKSCEGYKVLCIDYNEKVGGVGKSGEEVAAGGLKDGKCPDVRKDVTEKVKPLTSKDSKCCLVA